MLFAWSASPLLDSKSDLTLVGQNSETLVILLLPEKNATRTSDWPSLCWSQYDCRK